MKKSYLSLLLLVFAFCAQSLFAEVSFLSPAEGKWGNKQMLMIDNEEDGDYFYSVDGSDPELFGFAYDGPVFLDIEGDVTIKVCHISLDGVKDYGEVTYNVTPNRGDSKSYSSFIYSFYFNGLYDYIGDKPFSIPDTLTFSLEKEPTEFFQGGDLSVSPKSVLVRYVPCTVKDDKNDVQWRFIIRVNPQEYGIFSKREVPFVVEDWDTVTFNNDKLIYKIDSEYWGQPTEPVTLDRSVSHMISWQSVDYKIGNNIEYFVLPPKPELVETKNDDGSYSYYLEGDESYSLSIIDNTQYSSPELFNEICVDVFYGEKQSDTILLGIYSDSVYQGEIEVSYDIDKRPPSTPEITASAKTFYSRNDVNIDIKGYEDSNLYVAISEPFIIENTKDIYDSNDPLFDSVLTDNYQLVENDSFTTVLKPIDQKIAYYKVSSYCEKGNKKSLVNEYSVILDQSSFYFNKNATNSLGEGTLLNPFTSFEQLLESIDDMRTVSLRLSGDLYIDKKYELHSNLNIINNGDGRIVFAPTGSIEIGGSSLEIEDCRIQKISSSSVSLIVPLFKISSATLDLKNCQISTKFSKNGTIIDSSNSVINVQDSIISITADAYSSFISSIDSRILINNSSISTTGDTSVILSLSRGNVDVLNSNLKIIGKIGRVAELFGVEARFENNEYKGVLDKSSKAVTPIFSDKKTKLIEKDNTQIGF